LKAVKELDDCQKKLRARKINRWEETGIGKLGILDRVGKRQE
jgi:hypothetical protein